MTAVIAFVTKMIALLGQVNFPAIVAALGGLLQAVEAFFGSVKATQTPAAA